MKVNNLPTFSRVNHLTPKTGLFSFISAAEHKRGMKVLFVPVLEDNYSYLIVNTKTNEAIAVDPAEPRKVISAAEENNLKIKSIFTTHHHWDHANGNPGMVEQLPGITVYGGDDRIPSMTNKVVQGDEIEEVGLKFKVFSTPCHTSGHVLYYLENNECNEAQPTLFTGDTLFLGGCGKFFEGNATQMYDNFHNKIMKLPEETQMYPGHEYSVANLNWVKCFDSNNQDLLHKLEWCLEMRASNKPTLPTSLKDELTYNPFMRLYETAILNYTSLSKESDPIEIFSAIRELKNQHK